MIQEVELTTQPSSGEFEERIYDIESCWNSSNWSWVKFTNEDCEEWCGMFRGMPRAVSISKTNNIILVLTSDYLFQLDSITTEIVSFENSPQYMNLTSTPMGEFILSDYYHIYKVTKDIHSYEEIKAPIEMDMIKFKNWDNNVLEFTCEEFTNWDRHLIMEYDCTLNQIKIQKG